MAKSMEALLKEIKDAEPIAAIDPLAGNPKSRVGRETQRNIARQTLERARKEYAEVVGQHSTYILVAAEPAVQVDIAHIAASECGCIAISGAALYERVAGEVFSSMPENDRRLTSTQEGVLNNTIYTIENELGVLPSERGLTVAIERGRSFKTVAEFTDMVRQWMRKTNGDTLNKLFIVNAVAKEALSKGFISDVPVFLTNLTDDEVARFLNDNGENALDTYQVKAPKGDLDADKVSRVILAVAKAKSKQG